MDRVRTIPSAGEDRELHPLLKYSETQRQSGAPDETMATRQRENSNKEGTIKKSLNCDS
jgi:hypothetical protein